MKNLNNLLQNKALRFFLYSLAGSPMSIKFTMSVSPGFLIGVVCSLISRLAKEQETDGLIHPKTVAEKKNSQYAGANTDCKEKTVLQQHLVL